MTKGPGSVMSHFVDYFRSSEVLVRSQDIPEVTRVADVMSVTSPVPVSPDLNASNFYDAESKKWHLGGVTSQGERGRGKIPNWMVPTWDGCPQLVQGRKLHSNGVTSPPRSINWTSTTCGVCPQMLKGRQLHLVDVTSPMGSPKLRHKSSSVGERKKIAFVWRHPKREIPKLNSSYFGRISQQQLRSFVRRRGIQ